MYVDHFQLSAAAGGALTIRSKTERFADKDLSRYCSGWIGKWSGSHCRAATSTTGCAAACCSTATASSSSTTAAAICAATAGKCQ